MRDRQRIVIILLIGLIGLLAATRYILLDALNTQGVAVYALQQEIRETARENALLKAEILRREALITIASEAARQGFQHQPVEYLH